MNGIFKQWLESEFLKYLKDWEDDSLCRTDIEEQYRQKLVLSRETMQGLRITGMPLIHQCEYMWFN